MRRDLAIPNWKAHRSTGDNNLMNLAKKSTACHWVALLSWCILTLTIILPLSGTIVWAQPVNKNSAQAPLRVIAVVNLTDIFELNLNKSSYSVRFMLVFINDSEDLNILRSFWINNARYFKVTDVKKYKIGGRYYESATVTAEIVQNYDITKFPFDHQVLTINIFGEAKTTTSRQIRFFADSKANQIDPYLQITGWEIEKFNVRGGVENFHFQFENPELDTRVAVPRLTMTVTLQRQGLPLFFSLFTGQLVAFLIAALTYFLDFRGPIIRNRFALAVGAFFAAVANTYNISRYLPITNQFTFAGKFVIGIFTFIGLAVLGTVIVHNHDRSSKHGSGVRFNFWWGLITILFFTGYLIYLFAVNFIT